MQKEKPQTATAAVCATRSALLALQTAYMLECSMYAPPARPVEKDVLIRRVAARVGFRQALPIELAARFLHSLAIAAHQGHSIGLSHGLRGSRFAFLLSTVYCLPSVDSNTDNADIEITKYHAEGKAAAMHRGATRSAPLASEGGIRPPARDI